MRGPIFIGGTGRSGTTVLVRLLGLHPEILAVRWESQFLVAPRGLVNVAQRGWRRGELSRLLGLLEGRWFRRVMNEGKPNEYEAGLVADVEPEELAAALDFLRSELAGDDPEGRWREIVRSFTHRLLDPAAERAGASRWCEKTPRNILFADRLAEIFPDAQQLHILRDGRDVVSSMVERQFWPIAAGSEFPELRRFRGEVTVDKAAEYWRTVLELANRITAGLDPERYLELRFEDLIADTAGTVERICGFLGLPADPRLLDYRLHRPHVDRWKDDLSAGEAAAVESICEPMMDAKGYG